MSSLSPFEAPATRPHPPSEKPTARNTTDATDATDGTTQLLRAGIFILLAGAVAALLAFTVFGGISRQGPHTNGGWLSLLAAMSCLPFGLMLTVLGAAKWLRNRRMSRNRPHR